MQEAFDLLKKLWDEAIEILKELGKRFVDGVGSLAGTKQNFAFAGGGYDVNIYMVEKGDNKKYSPFYEDGEYSPHTVEDRVVKGKLIQKPPYEKNIAHDKKGGKYNKEKDPEPFDAEDVYNENGIRYTNEEGNTTWYGQNDDGDIYRYFSDNQTPDGVHFSGIMDYDSKLIPNEVKKHFGIKLKGTVKKKKNKGKGGK